MLASYVYTGTLCGKERRNTYLVACRARLEAHKLAAAGLVLSRARGERRSAVGFVRDRKGSGKEEPLTRPWLDRTRLKRDCYMVIV